MLKPSPENKAISGRGTLGGGRLTIAKKKGKVFFAAKGVG